MGLAGGVLFVVMVVHDARQALPARAAQAGRAFKEARWAAWRVSNLAITRHAGQRASVRSQRARPRTGTSGARMLARPAPRVTGAGVRDAGGGVVADRTAASTPVTSISFLT